MQDLTLTLVQRPLEWEAPADNRRQIASQIAAAEHVGDLVILPEMFTTGFSMNAVANAESPGGETEQWLQQLATEYQCAVTGSIAVQDNGAVYNRLLFATPHGVEHYDKRHLFRMAGEHRRYASGGERRIVNWRGWRICLQVCYDLRFPVFSRNREDYDLLLYVANWPAPRAHHWRNLLFARAIENQTCVAAVNRIGSDANGLEYQGDSMVVAADGTLLLDLGRSEQVHSVTVSGRAQQTYRNDFPCHLDADGFNLD
jgi:predicted amidohydrolase